MMANPSFAIMILGLLLLAVLWFTNREQVLRFGRTLSE
jgi:4-amino-4-deoxy-L-arabinose transferase-like glycosyltransferase